MSCDELLSNFAINFNLCRYSEVISTGQSRDATERQRSAGQRAAEVGRCRLTVTKPTLKAPTVTALEAKTLCTAFKVCFQFQLAPLRGGAAPHEPTLPAPPGEVHGARQARGWAWQMLPATSSTHILNPRVLNQWRPVTWRAIHSRPYTMEEPKKAAVAGVGAGAGRFQQILPATSST